MRKYILPLVLLASLSTACGGDGENAAPSAPAGAVVVPSIAVGGVRVVAPADAQALLADGGRVLIDVRTPEEYDEGHLAGAILINFNAADFADRIGSLDRAGSYVIYCRSGNRSGQALAVMESLGFVDVADIGGGIVAWGEADLPIEQ